MPSHTNQSSPSAPRDDSAPQVYISNPDTSLPIPIRPVISQTHSLASPQYRDSDALSNSSSRLSGRKSSTAQGDAKSASALFGKTSGWLRGSKFDIAELAAAAETRNHDTFKKCLKAGLNVNYCRWMKGDKVLGEGARSIADVVACRRDLVAMQLLIDYSADLTGQFAASFASSPAVQERFRFMFKEEERKAIEKASWTTPLHLACRYGYLDMVRIIIEAGRLNPNVPDSQGQVPLQAIATGSASVEVADYLLRMGAQVDAKDFTGATPLAVAALQGGVELVRLFVDRGAYIDGVDNYNETAIFNAALQNQWTTVALLAARGGDIDTRNIKGISAFFKAASKLNSKMMNHLVQCGCDVDSRDNNGCTALLRAVMARNITLVTHLLHLGADIDARDNNGWTPLFAGMLHDEDVIIRLLLQSGPGIDVVDNYNNNYLHQAGITGATTVVRHILATTKYQTSTQALNLFGETPLTLACKYSHPAIVRLLLKHNVDYQSIDPNGYIALDRAMYWGSFACCRLLIEASNDLESRPLYSLQQGRHDQAGKSEDYDMIVNYIRGRYPSLILPQAVTASPMQELFARAMTREGLKERMHMKQGKPRPTAELIANADESKSKAASPDPFEACMPESPITQIINQYTTNVQAGGVGALEVGAVGANVALNVAAGILGL